MSSSTTPANAPISNRRWLYRCVHEHAHEVRNDIREKFSQIERLRLEGGYGLVNDPNPGDWNWVPEADAQENCVAWIKVKDKSCTLPSDDEIQELCSSNNVDVVPSSESRTPNAIKDEKEVAKRSAVPEPVTSNQTLYTKRVHEPIPNGRPPIDTNCVWREGGNAVAIPPITSGTRKNDSRPIRFEFGNPEYIKPRIQNPSRTETTQKSGVLRKVEATTSSRERHQFVERTQSYRRPDNYSRRNKWDDIQPEIVVVETADGDEEPVDENTREGENGEMAAQNMQSGIRPKRRGGEDGVREVTELVTWFGLHTVNQTTPTHETSCLLETFKSTCANLLPPNLTLLTYFFRTPIRTFKKYNECFYKDLVTRYVPIIKIKIQGRPNVDVVYDVQAIVDIGSDLSIAPQLGFSKKMTRDIVLRSFENHAQDEIQLRWRKEGRFQGSEYVKIALKPEVVGIEGRAPAFPIKLIVAKSFEMSHLVLGYNFLRLFVPAVDLDNKHLYLIHREEENYVMRFDIERWVTIDEVIFRLGNPPKIFMRSSATKAKLYEKRDYPHDQRYYPIRNEAIEEKAPPALMERDDIFRFDFCNSMINTSEFCMVPEDQRYSYPSIPASTVDNNYD